MNVENQELLDRRAYERGIYCAKMNFELPGIETGISASPWVIRGFKMGLKYGDKAYDMYQEAKSIRIRVAN